MSGVGDAVQSVGAKVLGGDLTRSEQYLVDVCVLGTAERPHRCLEQFGNVRELIGHPRRLMDPYVRNVHG